MRANVRLTVDFDDVRAFVEVAKQGSFTKAAVHLSLSQPALSRRVARLEKTFGAELFDRSSHRAPTLTPLGESLLGESLMLLANSQRLLDIAAAQSSANRVVSLGMSQSGATLALPLLYGYSQALDPPVQLTIVPCPSGPPVLETLSDRRAELAIGGSEYIGPDFESVPLGSVKHVAIGSPSFLGDGEKPIEWEELRELPLLLPIDVDHVRYGLPPDQSNVTVTRGEFPLLMAMAQSGMGVAIVAGKIPPPGMVGRYVHVEGVPQESQVDLIWLLEAELSQGARRLIREARRHTDNGRNPVLNEDNREWI
jgi:DNA-binding transcriptional LysR family regulator